MKNLKITTKITILMVFSLISMATVTFIALTTINQVKVNGDLYNRIAMNKDLTADILPPPFYLIEAYHIASGLLEFAGSNSLQTQINNLKKLEKTYIERHDYWEKTLPEGELKKTVVDLAYNTGIRFFKMVNDDLIPAVKNEETTTAIVVLKSKVTPLYQEHRFYIDNGVKKAIEKSMMLEEETKQVLGFSSLIMIITPLAVSLIILIIGILVIINISTNMKKVLKGVETTSTGDFTTKIQLFNRTELGLISKYLNTMIDSMSSMIGGVKTHQLNCLNLEKI